MQIYNNLVICSQTKVWLPAAHMLLRQNCHSGCQRPALLPHHRVCVLCMDFGNYRFRGVQCVNLTEVFCQIFCHAFDSFELFEAQFGDPIPRLYMAGEACGRKFAATILGAQERQGTSCLQFSLIYLEIYSSKKSCLLQTLAYFHVPAVTRQQESSINAWWRGGVRR